MKTLIALPSMAAAALLGLGLLVSPGAALPRTAPAAADTVHMAAVDCYAVGQRLAQQNGGQLAKATPSTQGGQAVCVIVVLVPGQEGERPRRAEFVVPQ